MCIARVIRKIFGTGGSTTPIAQRERIAAPPPLRPAQPVREVPTPQEIKKEYEDPNLIIGKKRKQLEVDKTKKGVQQFDAIDPGINIDSPPSGIPKPTQ